MRGGGGNFGVVTSFLFQAHPVHTVVGGPMFWSIDDAREVMQWYWKGDFLRELSDQAIDVHLEHGSNLPTGLSLMHLYPIDGAVHRARGADRSAGVEGVVTRDR